MKVRTRLKNEIIEKYTKEGYWINKTLSEYLNEAVEKYPDKEAVVDRDRRVTYVPILLTQTVYVRNFLPWPT